MLCGLPRLNSWAFHPPFFCRPRVTGGRVERVTRRMNSTSHPSELPMPPIPVSISGERLEPQSRFKRLLTSAGRTVLLCVFSALAYCLDIHDPELTEAMREKLR